MTERLHVAVPIGVGRSFSETTTGVLEVTPMLTRNSCNRESMRCDTIRQLKVTVGLAWKPAPRARGQGFFFQPRLSGMWTFDSQHFRPFGRASALTYEQEHGFQVTLGMDVGYRVVTRRSGFFFEPMLGLGMGYSVNQRRKAIDVSFQYGNPMTEDRTDRAITDLDLDLVRLGVTF